MTQAATCPRCQSPLAAEAPEGLCAACLMAGGMASTPAPNPSPAVTTPWTDARQAAAIAELAPHFPQLEIIELLGQGGMGAVYKARQKHLDRLVALKVIPPEASKDPAFAERFSREARALARLNHPNIVTVHDFGQSDGVYFLLMEFVDGLNLRQTMRAGKLSPQEALVIVPHICEALQYAHDQGIVHRDIKPENVLLDKSGRVKIADFGLAKLLTHSPHDFTLTHSMQVMGTPRYMAPEQIEKPMEVDHRADIYSLGVMFYEMLTGEIPMGRFAPPSQKVQIDIRIDEIVLRSLEREPARRYQRVSEVKTELDSVTSSPNRTAAQLETKQNKTGGDVDSIRRKLYWPGIGFVAGGVLGLLFCLYLGEEAFRFITTPPHQKSVYAKAYLAWLPFLIPWSILVFTAGIKILRMESYRFSLIGSCVALLPFSPSSLITIPLSFWGLAVLTSREGRRAFEREIADESKGEGVVKTEPFRHPQVPTSLRWLGGALIFSGAICLFPVALVLSQIALGGSIVEPLGLIVFNSIALPSATLMILAGYSLQRLENYRLVKLAAILACLPLGCMWPATLLVGIWGVIVLFSADVKRAFAQSVEEPSTKRVPAKLEASTLLHSVASPTANPTATKANQADVYWPATGLIIVGSLAFLVLLLATIWMGGLYAAMEFSDVNPLRRNPLRGTPHWTAEFAPGLWWGAAMAAPTAVLMIAGGCMMRRMKSHRLALIGGSAALAPCGPLWLVSLPVGIWAIWTLLRPEVKSAFEESSNELARGSRDKPQLFWPGLGLAGGGGLGLALVSCLGVAWWHWESGKGQVPFEFLMQQMNNIEDMQISETVVRGNFRSAPLLPYKKLSVAIPRDFIAQLPPKDSARRRSFEYLIKHHEVRVTFAEVSFSMIPLVPLLILVALQIPWSLMVMLAGIKMARMESYRTSVVGAWIALLPISPAAVLTIPLGFWALVVLASSKTREAYRHAA